MTLPEIDQWIWAARGGAISGSWWESDDSRDPAEAENFADEALSKAALEGNAEFVTETWDDKHDGPARVGSFHANGYGLFDVGGNVAEICSDLGDSEGIQVHAYCGGSFLTTSKPMQTEARSFATLNSTAIDRGVRPVLNIRD